MQDNFTKMPSFFKTLVDRVASMFNYDLVIVTKEPHKPDIFSFVAEMCHVRSTDNNFAECFSKSNSEMKYFQTSTKATDNGFLTISYSFN